MAKKSKNITLGAERRQGTVIRNTGSSYVVETDDGKSVNCRVKGNFRIKGIRTTNPVSVGDRVIIASAADDADYIVGIEPRRNYIIRRASNLSKESHILASNIDRAILVASLREPETPLTFIDRFLATSEAYSIPAAVIINKMDTWDEEDRELAEAIRHLYDSIGYPTLFVSATTGEGLDSLRDLTRDNISLLAGNSGVGKSSLINALIPGADLRTGEISDIHHTGMHTTTFSEMLSLPYGGKIIDIPGVRGFGTIEFEPSEVSHYFPEIFEIGRNCRYSDCKHTGEPGCAVEEALEQHRIAQSRYASYLSVLEEASEEAGADKYRKPF
ncbi:MAG: ribosome small subunit-dependent GTPase A [Bacteroides sp.]|nr:ribosome small subunit-dependent GTPase A [Bacteroides sp.]MBD5290362.1 ribosome small subunit-dependent GTPase A [Bacteroides sp.]MBD5307397.1 ribosome small subunit-dependent GTPase A [Bacteroides sp.]